MSTLLNADAKRNVFAKMQNGEKLKSAINNVNLELQYFWFFVGYKWSSMVSDKPINHGDMIGRKARNKLLW